VRAGSLKPVPAATDVPGLASPCVGGPEKTGVSVASRLRRCVMLKKVAYLAALVSGCLMHWGCDWYNLALDNIPRVIHAVVNEDFLG